MTSPLPIGIGDLVKVVQGLMPQDNLSLRSITELLGFGWLEPEEVSVDHRDLVDRTVMSHTIQPQGMQSQTTIESPKCANVSSSTPKIETQVELVSSILQELPKRSRPDYASEASLPIEMDNDTKPSFDPLIQPNCARALVAHAIATVSMEGPIDVNLLSEWIVQCKAITEVPRLPTPTLAYGVQLLLDLSEAMLPYRNDQIWLADQVKRLVGQEKCSILNFSASPLFGAGNGPQADWKPYSPPPYGTPVMILTDLGVGYPARQYQRAESTDWHHLAAILSKARCPMIVFTPYSRGRHAALNGYFPIVTWDRTTTASLIRNIVGKGHPIL